jgi:2,4-dienoyl-CoA reductase-like NADH-dependent reductase (Old Yellow Enzyme family)
MRRNAMKTLFDEVNIGNMTLKNRFVRSATWEGMCDERGAPGEKLASLYGELAAGEVGLIISGYAYVKREGKASPGQFGIYDDSLVPPTSFLLERVHSFGGKIAIQLVHAGGQAKRSVSGLETIAPSALPFPSYAEVPREMTEGDIRGCVEAFADAAERARASGFDAIQLHGAHGFLISQFLSPATNKRDDAYGGGLENRSRFLMDVYRAVRERVGAEFPVFIKVNADDFTIGGLSFDESVRIAEMLNDAGIDAIEVSGGTPASGEKNPARFGILSPEKEAYHREFAAAMKEKVKVPVILVGGLRSPRVILDILLTGDADLFSMSRPFIREPSLINRWYSGDNDVATCISCNGCFEPGLNEGGIYCVVEKRAKEK